MDERMELHMRFAKTGERVCAFPDCTATVTDDDHCSGCGHFICDAHDRNPDPPMGFGHEVVEHWTFDEDDQ